MYRYSNPERRSWAFDALGQSDSSLPIWCGDVMIGSYEVDMTGGDLGVATTPGTGFGIVGARFSAEAINACRRLGENLAAARRHSRLPRLPHLEHLA
jgi:hypothetical protein